MYFRILLFIAIFATAFAYGCSGSDFKGGAKKAAEDQSVGSKGNPGADDAGGPDETAGGPDTDTLNEADNKDDGDGTGGDTTGEEDPSDGDGGRSIFDTINDFIDGFTEDEGDEFEQPDDGTVIFGANKVFHIGDDGFQDTSCRFEIDAYRLKGTQYYFEFEVLEDETPVNVDLNKICGIDYEDISTVRLLYGSYEIKKEIMNTPTFSVNLLSGEELDKGKYVIVVESGRGDARNPNDFDNFVVGELKVQSQDADKPIKAGRVGARSP